MPKAYWVANVEVTDAEVYGSYAKIAKDAIESHGGTFVARGGRHVQCEGRDRARVDEARLGLPPGRESMRVRT